MSAADSQPEVPRSREVAEALRAMGAVVALNKRGEMLRVDLRPVADRADDALVSRLAGSTRLTELYLAGTPISDASVETLSTLTRLQVLDLQNTSLGDVAIERLCHLPALGVLLIRGSPLSDGKRAELRRRMTRIRIVG